MQLGHLYLYINELLDAAIRLTRAATTTTTAMTVECDTGFRRVSIRVPYMFNHFSSSHTFFLEMLTLKLTTRKLFDPFVTRVFPFVP